MCPFGGFGRWATGGASGGEGLRFGGGEVGRWELRFVGAGGDHGGEAEAEWMRLSSIWMKGLVWGEVLTRYRVVDVLREEINGG